MPIKVSWWSVSSIALGRKADFIEVDHDSLDIRFYVDNNLEFTLHHDEYEHIVIIEVI